MASSRLALAAANALSTAALEGLLAALRGLKLWDCECGLLRGLEVPVLSEDEL